MGVRVVDKEEVGVGIEETVGKRLEMLGDDSWIKGGGGYVLGDKRRERVT